MNMRTRFGVALAAPVLLWTGVALGQAGPTTKPSGTPPVHQGSTPHTVEGRVVKIDLKQSKVTIQSTDGSMHEFQASTETLQDLKVGDRIEARLRQ